MGMSVEDKGYVQGEINRLLQATDQSRAWGLELSDNFEAEVNVDDKGRQAIVVTDQDGDVFKLCYQNNEILFSATGENRGGEYAVSTVNAPSARYAGKKANPKITPKTDRLFNAFDFDTVACAVGAQECGAEGVWISPF